MKIDITHVAKLANLPLSDEEKEKYTKQLSEVLDYIAKLNELDTTNIEETSQVTGLTNITREDTTLPSLPQEDALSQAKNKFNGLFAVKGIFENE